jgi:hypothetical protein
MGLPQHAYASTSETQHTWQVALHAKALASNTNSVAMRWAQESKAVGESPRFSETYALGQGPVPYRMSRDRGSATPIATMSRAPVAPIDAAAHRTPTSVASVPASMLPSVTTTEPM